MAEFDATKLAVLRGEKKNSAIGERICGQLADAGLPPAGQFSLPTSVNAITPLIGQLQLACEAQGTGGCSEVHVFHTKPTSGALCQPVSQRLFPLDARWPKDLAML